MLIPHQFDPETHTYHVEKRWVVCLSDIISLNGLSDHSQVPLERLQHAAQRGNRFDEIVTAFLEKRRIPEIDEDVGPYFDGFINFLEERTVEVAGKIQHSMVWEHDGVLVGCTPDLPLFINGELWNVDCKTVYPVYGKARDAKHLAWRVQLQGQTEAWQENELFWSGKTEFMKKAILHCHPKLKNGYSFIPFEMDDSLLFDGAVRMAAAKLAAGYQVDRR